MAKYDPLYDFLRRQDAQRIVFTFDEVARLIGEKLPESAYKHPEWWTNENSDNSSHVQRHAWMKAGYHAEADLKKEIVSFTKVI